MAELAEDGVVFEQCFSHASLTLASHASLFSSRPPHVTGVLNNGEEIPEDLPLLAEEMRKYGYATASAVSLGSLRPPYEGMGLVRGFDKNLSGSDRAIVWAEDTAPLVGEALDYLQENRPGFLLAHFADPHSPFRAHGLLDRDAEVLLNGEHLVTLSLTESPVWQRIVDLEPGEHRIEVRSESPFKIKQFWAKPTAGKIHSEFATRDHWNKKATVFTFELESKKKTPTAINLLLADTMSRAEEVERYHREVAHVDAFLGELIEDLKRRDMYESSLILFTSDHGEGLYDHGKRGHAWDVYEESIHVPLIVKLPAGHGGLADLRRNGERLVRHMDVVPTIMEVCNLPEFPGQLGTSLLESVERVHVAEAHLPFAPYETVALRDERFKLIHNADEDSFLMFDLIADPDELEDVFSKHGSKRLDWQPMLRTMASLALNRINPDELDEQTRIDLEALGYIGD